MRHIFTYQIRVDSFFSHVSILLCTTILYVNYS